MCFKIGISIHALREEGDQTARWALAVRSRFLSTPSARRATLCALDQLADQRISIHALREEGDAGAGRQSWLQGYFYPRPPRGGRPISLRCRPLASRFLSTPSARRATCRPKGFRTDAGYFYPRPPRGGRPSNGSVVQRWVQFLSTPSARRATADVLQQLGIHPISIHALREEGDPSCSQAAWTCRNFYPRPPRGGRPSCRGPASPRRGISIHALREEGDVRGPAGHDDHLPISIHALREEGDWITVPSTPPWFNFYPRPPRGGRRGAFSWLQKIYKFLSTPSARRATVGLGVRTPGIVISIHALREEGDRQISLMDHKRANFYPRPPRGGRRR